MEIKALQCMKLIIDVRFPGESYAHWFPKSCHFTVEKNNMNLHWNLFPLSGLCSFFKCALWWRHTFCRSEKERKQESTNRCFNSTCTILEQFFFFRTSLSKKFLRLNSKQTFYVWGCLLKAECYDELEKEKH